MTKDEYEKVFQHINDLAQKHALGKIPQQKMYDGLKKLLEELIAVTAARSIKFEKRKGFCWGFLAGAGFLMALAYAVSFLWQKGFLGTWMKEIRF